MLRTNIDQVEVLRYRGLEDPSFRMDASRYEQSFPTPSSGRGWKRRCPRSCARDVVHDASWR